MDKIKEEMNSDVENLLNKSDYNVGNTQLEVLDSNISEFNLSFKWRLISKNLYS